MVNTKFLVVNVVYDFVVDIFYLKLLILIS